MSEHEITPSTRAALWALAAGNVVIGTGALAFFGMLDTIARDLDATPSAIGVIAGLFSLGISVSGPVLGAWTSRYDRRVVLTCSLGLFAIGHFAAALAPGYWSLLVIRVLTSFAGTLFTPQAAATTSLLVPPDRRARSMSFVFLGWAIATVLGVPAGAWIAAGHGWRIAMAGIGAMSTIGAIVVFWRVPGRLFVARVDGAAWRAIAVHPTLLAVVCVTAIHASAQFTLYSYIVIAYHDALRATASTIALLFAWTGVASFAGNLLGGRIADRIGTPTVIASAIASMMIAFVLWILIFAVTGGATALALAVVAGLLWGAGNFAAHSMQQVRLVDLAPALAPVSVALNTSAIYLGQFIGATTGGFVLAHPFTSPASLALPWVALPVFGLALGVSITAQRRIERIDGNLHPLPRRTP